MTFTISLCRRSASVAKYWHLSVASLPGTRSGPDLIGCQMNLREATKSYEDWLGKQTKIVARDLGAKHASMMQGPFPLLRATFYRWMQLWNQHAGDLARGPRVLAVGDLHI